MSGDPSLLHDNAPRFAAGRGGHVESWFLRANHPTERKAIWLKSTILAPRTGRDAVAEIWCAVFAPEVGGTWAGKATVPVDQASFDVGEGTLGIDAAGGHTELQPEGGSSRGAVATPKGDCAWDVTFESTGGPLAEPLSIFPARWLVDGPFPKSKLLTPLPSLRFSGSVRVGSLKPPVSGPEGSESEGRAFRGVADVTVDLDGWHGMQGHNWGREHAFAYTWGQCLFGGVGGDPVCMVEGFSGRIRLAGRATPWISALVVRRGDEVYSFNRIIDLWAQKADVGDLSWTLRMKGPAGEAMLAMEAREPEVVCLGYTDPNGDMAYCLNSKLATTVLRVRPADREGFECRAEHHGALELLRRTADERFGVAA